MYRDDWREIVNVLNSILVLFINILLFNRYHRDWFQWWWWWWTYFISKAIDYNSHYKCQEHNRSNNNPSQSPWCKATFLCLSILWFLNKNLSSYFFEYLLFLDILTFYILNCIFICIVNEVCFESSFTQFKSVLEISLTYIDSYYTNKIAITSLIENKNWFHNCCNHSETKGIFVVV